MEGPHDKSVLPGFRHQTVEQRLELLVAQGHLEREEMASFAAEPESLRRASSTVENVIGVVGLPLGVATNFLIDGKGILVPMAVEEPSVIAAASHGAKITRAGGGIHTEMDSSWMIGQVELRGVADVARAGEVITARKHELMEAVDRIHPRLKGRGGGARDIQFRVLDAEAGHVVVHLCLDCRDAMGANLINTVCEEMAEPLSEMLGGRPGLRILSNLADHRCVTAWTRIPASALGGTKKFSAEQIAHGVAAASELAEKDMYRATTHNKGIMNGVDSVIIAAGNDWRSIEAGAHAFAALQGRYGPLAKWWVEEDDDGLFLCGKIRLPMAVGVVGGGVSTNPVAKACLHMMEVEKASDLGKIAASVGLAQNLAALRALASEGIQRGHMSLHAKSIALSLGARGDEIPYLVKEVVQKGDITSVAVQKELDRLRGPDGGIHRALSRAVGYAVEAQTSQGYWSGKSSPRVFETAIVSAALSQEPEWGEMVSKAREWISGRTQQEHHQAVRVFEETAYSLSMEPDQVLDLSEPILFDPIFNRKTQLLAALAFSLDREVKYPLPWDEMRAEIGALTGTEEKQKAWKPWALADLLAVRVLLGDKDAVGELSKLQWKDGSFWKNPVTTAISCLALKKSGREEEAKRAAAYLAEEQEDAGYWHYVDPDVWATAVVLRAFTTDPDFCEQSLPAAVRYILRHQNKDGGWGYASHVVSDNESTAHVLLAFAQAREELKQAPLASSLEEGMRKGLEYLKAGQGSGGLWTTWDSPGDAVATDVLGHILEAVDRYRQEGTAKVDCSRAVQWLEEQQDLDGGWVGGVYRSFAQVQYAVLRGLPPDSQAAIKGRSALLAAVNRDGGWGVMPGSESCASATGAAIAELCRIDPVRYEEEIRKGVLYLLERQKQNGTWEARPDIYGPRPLLFSIPFVSHSFASRGLVAASKAGIHPG